jgi:hypothetical protein
MYFELEYWCPNQSRWLKISGPDYGDLRTAIAAAEGYASATGRIIRVTDWDGQTHYRTGSMSW